MLHKRRLAIFLRKEVVTFPEFHLRREVRVYGTTSAAYRSLHTDRSRSDHMLGPKSVLAARLRPEWLTRSVLC